MNEQEQIQALQEELEQLRQQLNRQHQQITALHQKLLTLGKQENIPTAPASRPWSLENFIGLKLIQFIGIVVLVIGLSIGVKYAIDRNLISEFMRIALAYGAGILLYILSIRLKNKYLVFSALLFSGGMSSLYFTTYAAYVYYGMFPFAVSFAIMVILTVYTVYEAIRYNRQEIALLGLIGAYGIPFLISKNADRADLFFLYISLINAGVVFLTVRKLWKNVGRVAQSITWVLFIGWASTRFNIDQQATGILFTFFFFFLFLFNSLSFRIINKQSLTINDTYHIVLDNIALFVAALFVFGFMTDTDIAVITLCISAFAAIQSILIYRFWKDEQLVARMLGSLSLTLFVLFIFFNWSGFIVTLLWLLTAVPVFVWGFRMRSVTARMTSIILIGITLGKLVTFDTLTFTTVQKVIAYLVLGILLLVFSFFYQKFRQQLFNDKE